MFGSNDNKSTDDTQQLNAGLPLPMPPSDGFTTAPPDHLITPTAPPLNDTALPPADEPSLPPPPPTPEIVSDHSKSSDPKPSAAPPDPAAGPADDQLITIKQQALTNLAPMVHQLDQTPEEKFKTTMMLIQASDNAALIKDAYEAANAITDEKARAHALLDVVNEINYFTQHPENNQPA